MPASPDLHERLNGDAARIAETKTVVFWFFFF